MILDLNYPCYHGLWHFYLEMVHNTLPPNWLYLCQIWNKSLKQAWTHQRGKLQLWLIDRQTDRQMVKQTDRDSKTARQTDTQTKAIIELLYAAKFGNKPSAHTNIRYTWKESACDMFSFNNSNWVHIYISKNAYYWLVLHYCKFLFTVKIEDGSFTEGK